jgi:hypothetical protein
MGNAFKQKQDQAKREKLLAGCRAQIALGPVGQRRAVQAYAKGAGALRPEQRPCWASVNSSRKANE